MSSDPMSAAAEALDQGRPEETLALLDGLEGADAQLLAAWAHLDLGELGPAREYHLAAREGLPDQDLDLRWLDAELCLCEWRTDEARATFTELVGETEAPAFLERLALCLELQEDLPAADELLARAARIDPTGSPPVVRLTDGEFDRVVEDAAAALPEPFRQVLERCRLVTEPVPFRELVDPGDPGATPPDLLGLFTGPDMHALAEDRSAELPPTIYLFQRNLERACATRETLVEEIRITLYHEVGHLLGLDEDGVERLGLA